MPASPSPVPVTLLTGFLGAGKTTVLNHLLTTRPDDRIVVIENEYGDVGIDGELVRSPADALFEITDGCVCCSVRPELLRVLQELETEELDRVVIEASGLADPVPVMSLFRDSELSERFRLDGVVAVIDAAHAELDRRESDTFDEQLAYADVLVVNKTDRASEGDLTLLESRLSSVNPLASLVRARHGRVPPAAILHVGGHDLEETVARRTRRRGEVDHHEHAPAIGAVAVHAEGNVDVGALDLWLGRVVRSPDHPVLRMKGVIAVEHVPHRFVFQGVRSVIDVDQGEPWGDVARTSRIVFIGRDLDAEALQADFDRCVRPPRPS